MTQLRRPSRDIDIRKASLFAIIVNVMEIAVLVAFVLYVILTDISVSSLFITRTLAVVSAVTAGWGAMVDIRQALLARRNLRTIAELERTNSLMDALNHTLRAQRHDFLNHLQVVYSLMEMSEYTDATDYLDKVYGEIQSVSTILKTKSTAVNALLQVKTAACQEHGIAFHLDIKSTLEGVGLPSWELCGVLSNLLDNAMDAVRGAEAPLIALGISENLREYSLAVSNNGKPIPPELLARIFEPGFSTKGEGRGMGLCIVKRILEEYGGRVECASDLQGTVFSIFIPKQSA